jgi:hypothetical protein
MAMSVTEGLHEAYHHYLKVVTTNVDGLGKQDENLKAYQILQNSQLSYYKSDVIPVTQLCELGAQLLFCSLLWSLQRAPELAPWIYDPACCLDLRSTSLTVVSNPFSSLSFRWCRGLIYDLLPIAVSYKSSSRHWYDYMTSVMAIIGGVFTVFGMMESGINAAVSRRKRV